MELQVRKKNIDSRVGDLMAAAATARRRRFGKQFSQLQDTTKKLVA